ncbi:hypothetical protein BS47DRAFT_1345855 [Hydnum rufescens UP504]|uniref:Uncharacterized protein n=1 Tax=Hydnum rufescens UP504 TaxID=1448309 RepID=A0A9P6AUI9_9AGAM|nr:hypothetical protein BS47DRAFT_1345855 [Hydnum rufescens UP504]
MLPKGKDTFQILGKFLWSFKTECKDSVSLHCNKNINPFQVTMYNSWIFLMEISEPTRHVFGLSTSALPMARIGRWELVGCPEEQCQLRIKA